jgi:hypothetical protein
MGKHDKFRAYWERIGEPKIEYNCEGEISEWASTCGANWNDDYIYRIKDDTHWKLRQKWIDSDFKLPIECVLDGTWHRTDTPIWSNAIVYREAVAATTSDISYHPLAALSKWLTHEELKGAMKKDVHGYLCREADKGGREDIEKAMHTIQIYLDLTK